MKLIIKQYLSSLREREELDAILPDLLSQMGLVVISRPRRGTRQSGVDVAAVGKINGEEEKVYLFSIKAGDLSRNTWNTGSVQSLRPSLDEIQDSYIPTRLPDEHRGKKVVICICVGGDIQEQVRTDVEGYIRNHKSEFLDFEEWNGDKLASLILDNFLREDLLPKEARAELRKSLALLDEPDASYRHFTILIRSLLKKAGGESDEKKVVVLRQINICLWILFVWARDLDNLEAAYLSGELAALHAWEMAKSYLNKETNLANDIHLTFLSILSLYQQISVQYIFIKILPHVAKRHALSVAIRPASSLDVNLKLFDLLGRLALSGIWAYSGMNSETEEEAKQSLLEIFQMVSRSIMQLISNNPALLLPIKDDQTVDISIAVLLLMLDNRNYEDIRNWLSEIMDRAIFSYQTYGQYPCNLQSYSDLLEHPETKDDEYRKRVTSGSVLYPMIAFWAALLGNDDLYGRVQSMKKEFLEHCNFQLWYPDEISEEFFYTNNDVHGAVLSRVRIESTMDELLKQIFDECEQSPFFEKLSAVASNLLPLTLVACRHYRLPIPPHVWKGFYKDRKDKSS